LESPDVSAASFWAARLDASRAPASAAAVAWSFARSSGEAWLPSRSSRTLARNASETSQAAASFWNASWKTAEALRWAASCWRAFFMSLETRWISTPTLAWRIGAPMSGTRVVALMIPRMAAPAIIPEAISVPCSDRALRTRSDPPVLETIQAVTAPRSTAMLIPIGR